VELYLCSPYMPSRHGRQRSFSRSLPCVAPSSVVPCVLVSNFCVLMLRSVVVRTGLESLALFCVQVKGRLKMSVCVCVCVCVQLQTDADAA
jgi:hypothetical protein